MAILFISDEMLWESDDLRVEMSTEDVCVDRHLLFFAGLRFVIHSVL